MNRLLAEALGTFVLVFAGTGALVVEALKGGTIGPVGIALTFGLAVFALIHCFGEISGAHFNPAVTLAFAACGRQAWSTVPGYLLAQFGGALTASLTLRLLFPASPTLGTTVPAGPAGPSFVFEFLLTFFLMLVILSVSTGAKEKGLTAGLVIGAVITLAALFAGPVSGASLNPARSLAPAVLSGAPALTSLWLYLTAPVLGALAAVPACRGLRPHDCCAAGVPCS